MDFSVAMSVYKNDKPRDFERALESVTQLQTVKPTEVILVVDGPISDELDQVVEKYERDFPGFRTIRLKENGGLGNALRLAVENASHELIARMDSDDVSLPTRFEQQLAFFESNPALDILGGNISDFIDSEENIVAHRNVPETHEAIKNYMRKRCPVNHVSVMYKKSAVEKAGGYQDLFWNEDYYLWIRMMLSGARFANTGTTLVNVRTGKDFYARRGGKPYFQSEKFLQRYMLEHKMIDCITYSTNVIKRWVMQCCLPNRLRGWVYRRFARSG